MKFFAFLLSLIFFTETALAGFPPTTAKGQQDAAAITTFNFQTPNKLATNVGGATLIESGNSNILGNPSFEASAFGTFWTLTAGTTALDTTTVIDGKRALKVTLASQALNLTQDSTLYAAQFADGVQGLAMVRVKTSVSGIKVCSRSAGATSTSLCVDVQANNKWGLYKIPFILGATSNGIAIHSNAASVTGDLYVDAGFVGAVDLKQDVDASRLVGATYFAGTTSCNWSRTSTTVGAFTATAACPAPTVETTAVMGSWQLTDTDLPRQQILNLPRGRYKATFILEMILGAGASSSFAINDGTATCYPISSSTNNSAGAQTVVECSFDYSQAGDRTFELYGASSASSLTITNNRTSPVAGTKFILEYFGNSSTYSSTNADTDWAACNFSTLAWQGLGTVTNNLQCKRDRGDLLMKGTATVSAVGAIAQIPLPLWSGVQLVTKGAPALPALQVVGKGNRGAVSAATYFGGLTFLASPSSSFLNIGCESSSNQGSVAYNGSSCLGNETFYMEPMRIPIEGWENSNVIIGSFGEVVTTPGVTKPFLGSAYITGTGCTITRQRPSNWLSVNSSGSVCVFNILNSPSVAPDCVFTPVNDGNNVSLTVTGSGADSTSSITATKRSNGTVTSAIDFKMVCHGTL